MLKLEENCRLRDLVEEKLKKSPEIRPFPVAVGQLLLAARDPSSNAYTFEKIIECDAGLSVRLLRLANSPLYGLDREIKGIAHAASILGIRQLKNLALSVAGSSMFSSGRTAARQRKALWEHSLACATVARLLAGTAGRVADNAFLGGIFHDVGKLFLYDVAPTEYTNLNYRHTGDDLVVAEKALFGVGHDTIGFKSAHAWGLPEAIKVAIGYHHKPQASPIHVESVTLLHYANRLAKAWGIGSSIAEGDEDAAIGIECLGLQADVLPELEEQARESFENVTSAWS